MINNPLDEMLKEIREKNAKRQRKFVMSVVSLIHVLVGFGMLWYHTSFLITLAVFLIVWGSNIAQSVKNDK